MKNKYKILIAAVILLSIYVLYLLMFNKETVSTVKVKKGKLITLVYATGNVYADSYATLRVEEGGNVVFLNAHEGQFVRKGELLLKTDTDLLYLQQKDAETNLQKAKVELANKAKTLDRNKKLLAGNSITVKEYDDSKREYDLAEIDLTAKNVALNLIKEKISKKEIHAPFNGLIVSVKTKKGDYLTPNADCFDILEPSSILINAQVDEQDLGKIEMGMPAIVSFDAFPNDKFTGKVFRIVPRTDEVTKINKVYIKLASLPPKINIGMTSTINIKTNEIPNAVTIPQSAIINKGSQLFVYSVQNGILAKKIISVGKTDGTNAEILNNSLSENDVIVANPKDNYKDGMKVKIKESNG
jgi:RND family efflux transporter MFP subunit